MKFKNGYNLIYEKTNDAGRKLYATKAGKPADTDKPIDIGLTDAEIEQVKLFYEGAGKIKASNTGIPALGDKALKLTIDGEEVLGDDTGLEYTITYVLPDYYDEATIAYATNVINLPDVQDVFGDYYYGEFYGWATTYTLPEKVYSAGEEITIPGSLTLFAIDYPIDFGVFKVDNKSNTYFKVYRAADPEHKLILNVGAHSVGDLDLTYFVDDGLAMYLKNSGDVHTYTFNGIYKGIVYQDVELSTYYDGEKEEFLVCPPNAYIADSTWVFNLNDYGTLTVLPPEKQYIYEKGEDSDVDFDLHHHGNLVQPGTNLTIGNEYIVLTFLDQGDIFINDVLKAENKDKLIFTLTEDMSVNNKVVITVKRHGGGERFKIINNSTKTGVTVRLADTDEILCEVPINSVGSFDPHNQDGIVAVCLYVNKTNLYTAKYTGSMTDLEFDNAECSIKASSKPDANIIADPFGANAWFFDSANNGVFTVSDAD